MMKKPTLKNKPITNNTTTTAIPQKKVSPKVEAQTAHTPAQAKKTIDKKAPVPPVSQKTLVPKTLTKSVVETKAKIEKVKMERDSFTMPKDEYAQIATLKKRLEALGTPAKKSELLRAGLKLLADMNDTQIKSALAKVPTIKTGRPKK